MIGKSLFRGGSPVESAGQPDGETCDIRGADLTRVRIGRAALLGEGSYARLADTFRSLADPSRARIAHSLLRQDLCTCDLAGITGLSEPSVSQHLRLLRTLRLVKTRREGRKVFYSLADAHVRFLLGVSLRHLAHEDGGDALRDEVAGDLVERGPSP